MFEKNDVANEGGNSQETALIVPLSDDQLDVEKHEEAKFNSPPRIKRTNVNRQLDLSLLKSLAANSQELGNLMSRRRAGSSIEKLKPLFGDYRVNAPDSPR